MENTLEHFVTLIETMNLPEFRRRFIGETPDTINGNLRWFLRNAGIRNSGHPNLREAINFVIRFLRNCK